MSLVILPLPGASSEPANKAHATTWQGRLFGKRVLFCCVLATVVYLNVPRSFSDPDIGWHLRDAQILLTTHHFIRQDLFSYTAVGAAWMNHEWLAELPFYAAWRLDGSRGLYLLTLLVIEVIMFGILSLALHRSRNITASAVLAVLGTFLATVSFGPRTLLFGWICLLIELAILQVSDERPRSLWLLPFLFAIWVNTHGSWMIGLVVYILVIVGRATVVRTPQLVSSGVQSKQLQTQVAVGFLTIGSLFINPYGWRLVAYPFNLAFHQRLNIANVDEWHCVDLHTPKGKFALCCMLALCVWQLIRPKKWQLSDLLLLFVGIYSGFTYSRFLFLLAILAAPIIAGTFFSERLFAGQRRVRPLLNCAVILFLAALVVSRMRAARQPDPGANRMMPERFPAALASLSPKAHVFNEYNWGGQLIWQQHVLVFVDSRVDIFEYNGTFEDYLDIIHLNRTQELLDKHHVNYVLFERNAPLVYFLKHTDKWVVIAEKDNVILLSRRTSDPQVAEQAQTSAASSKPPQRELVEGGS